ncbi:MAG: sigma-70 family RNA polymerase sigma factor [Elusimicrobiota bacterium]|jgi:RNA polymerase sigma-70 factor (ECF subfamily)
MACDPAEFERFVRRYQDMVYTTAARLLGRGPDAEDVGQETFLKAYERFDSLVEPGAGAWLRTTATNLSLNHLSRHRSRWKLFSQLSDDDSARIEGRASESGPSAEALSGAQEAQDLQEALLRLPDHQRVPLVLFHFEDMSYEEIASRLGVSLGKVKTDIFRARAALKSALGEGA